MADNNFHLFFGKKISKDVENFLCKNGEKNLSRHYFTHPGAPPETEFLFNLAYNVATFFFYNFFCKKISKNVDIFFTRIEKKVLIRHYFTHPGAPPETEFLFNLA